MNSLSQKSEARPVARDNSTGRSLAQPGNAGRCFGQQGYVMLAIVAMLAALAVALYKIVPQYAFQAQRDKEEELLFRGEAYRQAIQNYVRKFGRYPTSLDELLETNNLRFLRKLYKDPMTEDGEWRLIHVGPGGVITDSKVMGGASGTTTGLPQSTMRFSNPGGDASGQARADGRNPDRPAPNLGGGAIAGVASMSEEQSIRIWNDQTTYDKWEFIYNFRTDPIAMAGPLGQQQGGNPQPPPNPINPPGTGSQTPPPMPRPGQFNPFGAGGMPGRGAPFGIPPGAGTGSNPNQPDPPRRF